MSNYAPEHLTNQLDRLNNLGNALKQLSMRKILPLWIDYNPESNPGISVRFDDLRTLVGSSDVTKIEDTTAITYRFVYMGVDVFTTVCKSSPKTETVKLK